MYAIIDWLRSGGLRKVRWTKVRWANIRWAKVRAPFFLLLCHGDTCVGNMTKLTCCARFVHGVLLFSLLITIMHSDLIQCLFVFNIVVSMFAVTRGWDGFWVGSNRFVNG